MEPPPLKPFRPPFTFWLGTGETHWVETLNVPLFVSARRLDRLRGRGDKFRHAGTPTAIDSGGFTELSMFGGWQTSADDFGGRMYRFMDEGFGYVSWAAPQDWMCEPDMIAKTGLSVREHQERTVENFLYLREEFSHAPWIPVLQGYQLDEYLECERMYQDAGVDLTASLVGLGSVCRRQNTDDIGRIVATFAGKGYRLHGFGVKADGLRRYGHLLESADSQAWSFGARQRKIKLDGCAHAGPCSSCPRYALQWRETVLAAMRADQRGYELAA